MDSDQKMWKAYVFTNECDFYLMEGTVTGIVIDGFEMIRHGSALVPISDGWRRSKTEAKRDAAAKIAVIIGQSQAKLDKLRDEILHEDLTTEEAAA